MNMLAVDLVAPAAAADAPGAAGDANDALQLRLKTSDATVSDSTRSCKRRRRARVSKRLQRVLLAKYVAVARALGRLPDRGATEALLAEGHAEFFCAGGSACEPRLAYAAFMKLVRNRRCELARCHGVAVENAKMHSRLEAVDGGDVVGDNDQEHQREIRALVGELDRLRQQWAPTRASQEYDMLECVDESHHHQDERHAQLSTTTHSQLQTMMDEAGVPMLSEDGGELGIAGDGETDNSVIDGDLSTSDGYASIGASEMVSVPRAQLDLMLRSAQENLQLQKKLLEDVRAIEQRLSGVQ